MAKSNLNIYLSAKLDHRASIGLINLDIPKLQGQLKHLLVKVKIDPASLASVKTQLQQLQTNITPQAMGGIAQERFGVPQAEQVRANTQEFKNQTKAVESTTASINKKNAAIGSTNKGLKTQSTQWNNIAREMTVIESTIIAMKRVPVWMLAMTAFYAPLRSFQEGLQGIRAIDQQLVELAKVSGETKLALDEMRWVALELGAELGMTADKVLESTVAFARLGYTMRESAAFAREAITLSTVGNMGISDSTQAMISIMKAYDLELGEYEESIRSAIDSINEVGNNFAISQQDLAEILMRSSSAMKVAGNSLEESIALGTGANEIVQSAEKVGTALRTVSMRLRGVSEEGEDLSELVPTLEKKFERIGLTLKESETEFKSTYDTMKDLASVWDDLTDIDRASILEDVAG